ncbi:MAG: c-type cytochrome [Myxococcota bacterium]
MACSAEEAPEPSKPPSAPTSETATATEAPTGAPVAEPSATPSEADLVARGRSVWMSNCIACHAQDPALDGALGPAVIGASHELLEARVLRAEYPEGYTPKRDSKIMIALPHLEGEIDALHAYLNQ